MTIETKSENVKSIKSVTGTLGAEATIIVELADGKTELGSTDIFTLIDPKTDDNVTFKTFVIKNESGALLLEGNFVNQSEDSPNSFTAVPLTYKSGWIIDESNKVATYHTKLKPDGNAGIGDEATTITITAGT